MFMPFMGFLTSLIVFGSVGLVALRTMHIARRRLLALAIFIAAGEIGARAFIWSFGALVGNGNHPLQSRVAILGFLIGLPVVSSIIAWVVLKAVVNTAWFSGGAGEQRGVQV